MQDKARQQHAVAC